MASNRTRPAPWGLVGMLVLVGLGEAIVGHVEPSIVGVEPWDWRRTGQAASLSPEVRAASVLCFGDSLVKLGVQPRVLEAGLGENRRAYNLALCAGRAPSSYFLLRRVLEAGARPEALVVDFNDSFLSEPPETTIRLYSELLRFEEARELARTMARPDFASTVLTFQGLRVAKNRFEIRRAIIDALLGRPDEGKRAASVALRKNWKRNQGGQVMPKVATPLPDDPAAWAWVQPSGWRADPTNVAYLLAFFELAEAHQIPVFWLLPPLHPGFSARRAELGLNAPFDAFVSETLARIPRVVVVDGRAAKYDASVFIDMAHLNLDGSRRLSESLASIMAESLACPGLRVVALPPFRSPRVASDPGSSVAR